MKLLNVLTERLTNVYVNISSSDLKKDLLYLFAAEKEIRQHQKLCKDDKSMILVKISKQ